jgi:hypothetical protein
LGAKTASVEADPVSYVTDLLAAGDRLFGKRESLVQHWQDVAEQFAPDLADFTTKQTLGTDYAADLVTSYPLLVAREMNDQLGAMLRPSAKEAAVMTVEGLEDHDGKVWLEEKSGVQRRAMYDRAAQYVVAAKQFERCLGLFGNAVMSIEAKPDKSSLLFRTWHLRDVAWADDLSGMTECLHRKWDTPTAYDLKRIFGIDRLHSKVREHLQPGRDPYCEVKIRHVVVPVDMYDGPDKFRTKLVSLYIDVENEHVIEARGQRDMPYVVARWQRIAGTQYAASPAVICALPEARLLQAMTWTLLEAGEKHTNPPLLATEGMIRGDINVRAGDVTIVAAEYDERTGAVLRPLNQDKSGMPLGLELQQRSEEMLRKAFYADKLQMPQRGGAEETAYEVGQRVQQYIRDALPLVEPLEIEVNGSIYERSFSVLMMEGAFGSPDTIPQSLSSANIEFKFASPLREQNDRQKGQVFLEGIQLIQAGAALDPAVSAIPNAVETMREVLEGIGWKPAWLNSPEAVAAAAAHDAEQAKAQQMLDAMGQASEVAKNFGGARVPEGVQ